MPGVSWSCGDHCWLATFFVVWLLFSVIFNLLYDVIWLLHLSTTPRNYWYGECVQTGNFFSCSTYQQHKVIVDKLQKVQVRLYCSYVVKVTMTTL